MADRFFKLPQAIAARPDIPAVDKLVYAALADYIGHRRKSPGIRTLAARTGYRGSWGTVRAAVGRLQKSQLISIERRGAGQGNRYTLTVRDSSTVPPNDTVRDSSTLTVRDSSTLTVLKTRTQQNRHRQQPDKRARRKTAPPDSRIKEFLDFFCTEYRKALGRDYVVTSGKDPKTVQRLIASLSRNNQDPLPQLQRATVTMLGDPWARGRAAIGLLSSQLNVWLGGPARTGKGTFTPAKAVDTSVYDGIGKRFD